MFDGRITDKSILRVLVVGFLSLLLAALTAGLAGIHGLRSINDNASDLEGELRAASNLALEMQRHLTGFRAVVHHLSRDPDAIDAGTVRSLIEQAESSIARIAAKGQGVSREELWSELAQASHAFAAEARRCLVREDEPIAATRVLFELHQELVDAAASLINLNYRRAVEAQARIDLQSQRLGRQTALIVGACLLLSVVFAALTLRMATGLIHRMEEQAAELSRVSWHLLESQETAARRFSHELHDELGQSLTAVKANLSMLRSPGRFDVARIDDSLNLVDEAIANVREMSHLLHPRVLDDFGLDAALRTLQERLAGRTELDLSYESNFEQRVPRDTATHLFRIAQEALTNVQRHSGATEAHIRLWRQNGEATLRISDNGRGLRNEDRRKGLGLVAMAARARQLGGKLTLSNGSGGGLTVEVKVPVREVKDEQEDPHRVGG